MCLGSSETQYRRFNKPNGPIKDSEVPEYIKRMKREEHKSHQLIGA